MEMIEEKIDTFKVGEEVEGKIIAVDRSTVYVNLPPIGTGIVYGREFSAAKDILRHIKIGDLISASIIKLETKNGYVDLSLKEARKKAIWKEAEDSTSSKKIYEVVVKNANRGGLVVEWSGIRGFLPASQLSEKHYPKVLNGDKDVVLNELKKFINQKLIVTIESTDKETDTIIFSEHIDSNDKKQLNEKDKKIEYKVGDVKNGIVTGVVDFGVFITVDNVIEGLVHISEMGWGLIDNPYALYTVGENVQAKIIGIDDSKYSFSFKELQKNPWIDIGERKKVGETVYGVVIKYGTFGVFASIEAGVSGLIHMSNFENEEEMRNSLEIGKSYEFVITNLKADEQKLTLTPKDRYKAKEKN